MTDSILNAIEKGKLKKIYEDDGAVAILSPEPFTEGHIWILPKKQYVIMEQIPDYEIANLFSLANKISISLFDALHAQGTNIFIENGVPAGQKYNHFIINLVPRFQNDNVNFEWQAKQLTEEQMSTIELRIKENVKSVGIFQKKEKEPVILDRKEEIISEKEDNYFVKHLRKIP